MVEIIEKLKDMDLKEILGYAIGSEEAANKYYTDLAQTISPELAAIKFENLAKEEKTHKKALLNVFKKHFGNEAYKVPKGLPPLESSANADDVRTLIQALETAMKNEQNAHRVYTHLALQDKEHEGLFKYLADMEMGHYDVLRREKDSYEGHVITDSKRGERLPKDLWAELFKFQY